MRRCWMRPLARVGSRPPGDAIECGVHLLASANVTPGRAFVQGEARLSCRNRVLRGEEGQVSTSAHPSGSADERTLGFALELHGRDREAAAATAVVARSSWIAETDLRLKDLYHPRSRSRCAQYLPSQATAAPPACPRHIAAAVVPEPIRRERSRRRFRRDWLRPRFVRCVRREQPLDCRARRASVECRRGTHGARRKRSQAAALPRRVPPLHARWTFLFGPRPTPRDRRTRGHLDARPARRGVEQSTGPLARLQPLSRTWLPTGAAHHRRGRRDQRPPELRSSG